MARKSRVTEDRFRRVSKGEVGCWAAKVRRASLSSGGRVLSGMIESRMGELVEDMILKGSFGGGRT